MSEPFTSSNKVPKTLVMTYHSKNKIPPKVYKNIEKYAPNFRLIIYNNTEVVKFLKMYYPEKVVQAFYQLQGAHKADLFRYCYLNKYGGFYIDVKTELIKNVDDMFNLNNKDIDLYTVLSKNNGMIHQGIIASVPNNPIFTDLIEFMVHVKKPVLARDYFTFTRHFYNLLSNNNSITLRPGNIINYKHKKVYLYKEFCTKNPSDCYDGLDRRNFCCFIYDKVIKTRYSDYPF